MMALKIIGIIVSGLALLIFLILMLPVSVWLRADSEKGLRLRYRFLGKEFGEDPDPHNPIIRGLKKTLGISHLENVKTIRGAVEAKGAGLTLQETVHNLMLLLDRALWALDRCYIPKCRLISISAGEDAALDYGVACAIIYPLAGWLEGNAHLGRRAPQLDLRCDFEREAPYYEFELVIRLRIHHILRGLWYIVKKNVEIEMESE